MQVSQRSLCRLVGGEARHPDANDLKNAANLSSDDFPCSRRGDPTRPRGHSVREGGKEIKSGGGSG